MHEADELCIIHKWLYMKGVHRSIDMVSINHCIVIFVYMHRLGLDCPQVSFQTVTLWWSTHPLLPKGCLFQSHLSLQTCSTCLNSHDSHQEKSRLLRTERQPCSWHAAHQSSASSQSRSVASGLADGSFLHWRCSDLLRAVVPGSSDKPLAMTFYRDMWRCRVYFRHSYRDLRRHSFLVTSRCGPGGVSLRRDKRILWANKSLLLGSTRARFLPSNVRRVWDYGEWCLQRTIAEGWRLNFDAIAYTFCREDLMGTFIGQSFSFKMFSCLIKS